MQFQMLRVARPAGPLSPEPALTAVNCFTVRCPARGALTERSGLFPEPRFRQRPPTLNPVQRRRLTPKAGFRLDPAKSGLVQPVSYTTATRAQAARS
jgi:hypothetical protein